MPTLTSNGLHQYQYSCYTVLFLGLDSVSMFTVHTHTDFLSHLTRVAATYSVYATANRKYEKHLGNVDMKDKTVCL